MRRHQYDSEWTPSEALKAGFRMNPGRKQAILAQILQSDSAEEETFVPEKTEPAVPRSGRIRWIRTAMNAAVFLLLIGSALALVLSLPRLRVMLQGEESSHSDTTATVETETTASESAYRTTSRTEQTSASAADTTSDAAQQTTQTGSTAQSTGHMTSVSTESTKSTSASKATEGTQSKTSVSSELPVSVSSVTEQNETTVSDLNSDADLKILIGKQKAASGETVECALILNRGMNVSGIQLEISFEGLEAVKPAKSELSSLFGICEINTEHPGSLFFVYTSNDGSPAALPAGTALVHFQLKLPDAPGANRSYPVSVTEYRFVLETENRSSGLKIESGSITADPAS